MKPKKPAPKKQQPEFKPDSEAQHNKRRKNEIKQAVSLLVEICQPLYDTYINDSAKIAAMSAIITGHTASGKKLPNPEAVAEHAARYAEELFLSDEAEKD